MKTLYSVLTAAIAGLLAFPCLAHEADLGRDRYAVVVHNADLHPATPAAARRAVARIDAAALDACGVSASDLRDVIAAARKAPCWHDAMAGALAQVDDPLLLRAYHRFAGTGRQ